MFDEYIVPWSVGSSYLSMNKIKCRISKIIGELSETLKVKTTAVKSEIQEKETDRRRSISGLGKGSGFPVSFTSCIVHISAVSDQLGSVLLLPDYSTSDKCLSLI